MPLTATDCISLIITDLAVMEVTDKGFLLKEVFDGHTVEEVIEKTGAPVEVASSIRTIKY